MIVYLITNNVNGKRYVGQTSKSLEYRWNLHRYNSSCPAMKAAIRKYGYENFSAEVLFDGIDKPLADELEKEFIRSFCTRAPNGYNLTEGGEGIINPSKEIREARSRGNLGNKNALGAYRSPEYRKKLSDIQKGRKLTPEHKAKLSEAAKKRPQLQIQNGHITNHVKKGVVNTNCRFCFPAV